MLALFPLVPLALPPRKQATPPKPLPIPQPRAVTPKAQPTTKTDSSALALLASSAESNRKLEILESMLDWRYLPKANLSLRPTSAQGQKSLEAALRSAQGTITLTKDGQARLEITTPGKDALPRAKTLTDTKKLFAFRYDNDGKLAATERTFVLA